MSPLVYGDRVKETSTTTGTGTYSLAGAAAGFRTFVAGLGNASVCYYTATDGVDWECGIGLVASGSPDTLTRLALASSNGGALVNWGAGTRDIFCTPNAEWFQQRRVLTADQASTTVTTNVNVTGLSFAVLSGRRYRFRFDVLYRAAATTTGLRLSVTTPTFTKFGAVADVAVSTAADGTAVIFRGRITSSGDQVIGTLQLVYASEVSGSAVTVAQGSCGVLEVVV